jgi:hypothetical protein
MPATAGRRPRNSFLLTMSGERLLTHHTAEDPPHPLIDMDPHMFRVVRYMRMSDLGWWAGLTAAAPAAIQGLGADPCTYMYAPLTRLFRVSGPDVREQSCPANSASCRRGYRVRNGFLVRLPALEHAVLGLD